MDWLTKLRQKPKPVREQYALLGAVSVTVVIAGVWLATISDRYQVAVIGESVEETEGAFKQFFGSVGDQLAAVRSALTASSTGTTTDTTAAEVAPPAATSTPTIVVPTLTPEDIRTLNPRPILIATSSAASTTTP